MTNERFTSEELAWTGRRRRWTVAGLLVSALVLAAIVCNTGWRQQLTGAAHRVRALLGASEGTPAPGIAPGSPLSVGPGTRPAIIARLPEALPTPTAGDVPHPRHVRHHSGKQARRASVKGR
jgi:hypothetical protein